MTRAQSITEMILKNIGNFFAALSLLAIIVTVIGLIASSGHSEIYFPGLIFAVIFGIPAYIFLLMALLVRRWSEPRVRYILLVLIGIPMLALSAFVFIGVTHGSHQ